MNEVKFYEIMIKHDFSAEEVKELISSVKENNEVATKTDIKDLSTSVVTKIMELELRMVNLMASINSDLQKQINGLFWKILGGFAAVISLTIGVLKVAQVYLHL